MDIVSQKEWYDSQVVNFYFYCGDIWKDIIHHTSFTLQQLEPQEEIGGYWHRFYFDAINTNVLANEGENLTKKTYTYWAAK